MRLHSGNSLVGLGIGLLFSGCASHGLHRVMREYDFTPISPPQSKWEPGSVAEITSRTDTAPTLRMTPSAAGAGAANHIYDSAAPDVSTNPEEKLDLSVGVSLPSDIKAKIAAKGAATYSVVAKGNVIRRILIDEYAAQVFPKIAAKASRFWGAPLAEGTLYYFNEVWCSTSLEYQFYDSGTVALGATVATVPVDASAGYSWTSNGSLSYVPQGERVCLGYKARAIRQAATGEIVPEAAGKATALPAQAKSQPWGE